METIKKIVFWLVGLFFSLELLAVPISLYINHKETQLINEKKFLEYDLVFFILTYMIGVIIYEISKPKKRKK